MSFVTFASYMTDEHGAPGFIVTNHKKDQTVSIHINTT